MSISPAVIDDIKERIGNADSSLVWALAFATLAYAIFDHRDTCDEIKASTGWKKLGYRLKLILLWSMPVAGLISAYAASLAADKDEAKFGAVTNRLSKTESLLESATQELTRIEAKTKNRTITPEQHAVLVEKLDWTDAEAGDFGRHILSALVDSGFEKRKANAQILAMRDFGVFMFVVNVSNPPPHAIPIQRTFAESGIELVGRNASEARRMGEVFAGTNSNLVLIWVTQKP